ncbi:MAG TPA: 4-alpha-glucanotransferase [Bryobacteraceae bacterium]|nr:4-alpha-glucanotransferase [Bryobacteraceae bacterium]
MPLDDALRDAAERNGVQQDFWDIFGHRHFTEPETNRAILTALGVDCTSEETVRASMAQRDAAERARLLPPVLVTSENAPLRLHGDLDLEIITEDGERRQVRLENGVSHPELKLPLGYHQARTGDCTMRLIVTPDRAWLPAAGKYAGLGISLYGLRSHRNWGCGDFRDLCDLALWAVTMLHVDFIALNPLHAIHNRRPFNTSPYLPNSICYRNFLYLDVEGVRGYDVIRRQFEDAAALDTISRLRDSAVVEYEQVAAVKRRALEMIFEVNPPGPDCNKWIADEGDLLRVYATYCALDEYLHEEDPNLWVWPDWPEKYLDPDSPAVKQFAAEHEREILFHGWLQWNVDLQVARAHQCAKEAGMKIGLYHDLALATDRCGSDLWGHRKFYVEGCGVGSPPDDFSPTGQDWSFPPPNSRQHRADGYRLFAESIRKTMRHGGALRIDHVMRLFRLYWIPGGHDAAHGAYVRDHADDLVRILALESVRNQAMIVGEDLGTVEPEVREILAQFGILSYRLLYFERMDGGFKPPDRYPQQALAASTTHDLPTIAGFWTGADIEARLQAGTIDRGAYDRQHAERSRDKQQMLDALFAAGLLPSSYESRADRIPELTGELHYAIIGFLAKTPAMLWLVNQEDMTKERDQQNLPGTTAQYPNWSRKMRWSIEDLRELREARDCAAMVGYWVETTGRAH